MQRGKGSRSNGGKEVGRRGKEETQWLKRVGVEEARFGRRKLDRPLQGSWIETEQEEKEGLREASFFPFFKGKGEWGGGGQGEQKRRERTDRTRGKRDKRDEKPSNRYITSPGTSLGNGAGAGTRAAVGIGQGKFALEEPRRLLAGWLRGEKQGKQRRIQDE